MRILFPKFIKIRDFDSFDKLQLETEAQQLFSKFKNHKIVETSDQQNIQLRSIQSQVFQFKSGQLSFDKYFMQQHLQSFDFQVKNYLQSIFQDRILTPTNFKNEDLFNKKSIILNHSQQIQYYLRANNSPFKCQQAQIFMEKIKNHQKLQQFLKYVCQNSCDQIAFEMLIIANQVLKNVQRYQKQQLSYQKLIDSSKQAIEQIQREIKRKHLFQYLNFEKTFIKPAHSLSNRNQLKRKFLQFLIITLFLVIFEYFNNPYYHQKIQSQLKRHRFFNNRDEACEYDTFSSSDSESSEQSYFVCSKKRKKNK